MSISIKVKIVDYDIKSIKNILEALRKQIFKKFTIVVKDNKLHDLSFNLCKSYERNKLLNIVCIEKNTNEFNVNYDYTIYAGKENMSWLNDKLYLAKFNHFIRNEQDRKKIYNENANNSIVNVDENKIFENKKDVYGLFFQDEKYIQIKNKKEDLSKLSEINNNIKNKEEIMFSIIVASYNYSKYINMTLNSLVDQTYKNYEIIVVDDGSTDDSIKIIQEYQKHYKQIKLFQHDDKKNHGLIETIKLGILKSKGEYISFCESDDYWSFSNLQNKYDLITKYNKEPNIIINDIFAIGDPTICSKLQNGSNNSMKLFPNEINIVNLNDFAHENKIMTFSCTTVKKEELLKCNFNIQVNAWLDWNLWIQVLKHSDNKLYVVHQKDTYWRAHSGSQIQKKIEYNKIVDSVKDINIVINNKQQSTNDIKFLKHSFIVTSYNYGKYISQTLQSLVDQTYKNYEIIVVDDGSTDDSISIIKNFQNKYPNKIRLIQHDDKKNHGLIESLKIGISNAKGEYISFCESDDYLDKKYLFEKDKLLLKYDYKPNIIINDVNIICKNTNRKNNLSQAVNYRKKFFKDECNKIDIQNFKKFNYICTFSMVTVKKDIIKELNFESPVNVNIDWWLWAQISKIDNNIYYVNKKITFWRQHTDSYMSKQKNLSKSKAFKYFSEKIKNIIDN